MTPDRPRLNHASRNVIVNCAESIDPKIDAHDNLVTTEDPGPVNDRLPPLFHLLAPATT